MTPIEVVRHQRVKINVGVLLPAVTRTSVLASWNSNHLCHISWVVSDILFYLSVGKTQWKGNVWTWYSHHMHNTSGITSQHGRGTTKKLIDYHISCKYGASHASEWASITHIRTLKGVPMLSLAMSCTMVATQHSTTPQPLNTVWQPTSINKGAPLYYQSHWQNYQD